jgi:hypothetical protein
MAVAMKPQSRMGANFRIVRVATLLAFPVGADGDDGRNMQPNQSAGSDAAVATCQASAPGRTTWMAVRGVPFDTRDVRLRARPHTHGTARRVSIEFSEPPLGTDRPGWTGPPGQAPTRGHPSATISRAPAAAHPALKAPSDRDSRPSVLRGEIARMCVISDVPVY